MKSLLSTIKELGGINMREIRDLSGEGRTGRAGIPVGLFRRPSRGRMAGLKVAGFGLDELIPRLQELGFHVRADDVDGGVQDLRDMIQAELSGQEKIYAAGDAEEIWARERDARNELDAPIDSVRAIRTAKRERVRQIAAVDPSLDVRALIEQAIALRAERESKAA